MKIHEYQAKELFKKFGVPVPDGRVAFNVGEATSAAKELGGDLFVVKAQVHAGGRGKGKIYKGDQEVGRGVMLAKSIEEVGKYAENMLGGKLVTIQTGEEGKVINRILVEKGIDIDRELYLSIVLDRDKSRLVIMASAEGGMDIEEVARTKPEAILKEWIDPALGFTDYQATRLAWQLGLSKKQVFGFAPFVRALYSAFVHKDCSLVEINPLVVTKSGQLIALDGKINFDDSGLFRHKDIAELRDESEEDPRELEATKVDLSYVGLNGNIGCMVNGAGLAMATMDIIKHFGGEPANFLDVGGTADVPRVTAAFKLILSDPNVKAIFVNIFGGIVRCDVIAEGVVTAARDVQINVPLIIRLQGTNYEEAIKILAESGLDIISATAMDEGAKKAVEAAMQGGN